MLATAAILAVVFLVSLVGVWQYRKFSFRKGILDHPNERSSHEVPTPRGGGLVMALATIAGYAVLSLVTGIPLNYGYILASLVIIGIGLVDDLYSVWFFWRLIGQFAAAFIFIVLSGTYGAIYFPFLGDTVMPALLSIAVTSLAIVYFLNAYNFMDGIDGIAGLQAVIAGVCWLVVGSLIGLDAAVLLGGSLAAASLGFLILNWQPAKIFMGDAGSSFLGFSFAVLPIVATNGGSSKAGLPLLIGVLTVWPFIFDSLITLFRRGLRGEKVWSAHREHLYQRLVIGGWSHATVTSIYGVLAALSSAVAILYALTLRVTIVDVLCISVAFISVIVVFLLSAKYGGTK